MSASTRDQSPVTQRPSVVDEWGIYDPRQAGIEALMDLLDKRDADKVTTLQQTDGTPEPVVE